MSQSDFQSTWISHCMHFRLLHSFHLPLPHTANPRSLAMLYLRPWGCAQPYIFFSLFFAIFLMHIPKPGCWTYSQSLPLHSLLTSPLSSWGARGLCGGKSTALQREARSEFSCFKADTAIPVVHSSLLSVILVVVACCLLVVLITALSSNLIWWTQINDLPSACWQSSPS